MNLTQPNPDRTLVFSEQFRNRQAIQSRGGVLVGCRVGDYQGGSISPTAASSLVTFKGTESALINATQMTICVAFRTGTITALTPRIICRAPAALNDNQFFLQLDGGKTLSFYVSNAPGDFEQVIRANADLTSNTKYFWYCVYNGTLAAGSRGVLYNKGQLVASTTAGTLPPSMRASAMPITVFNFYGAAGNAPPNDFVLYRADVYGEAWGPQAVLDDYLRQTYSKVYGGGF